MHPLRLRRSLAAAATVIPPLLSLFSSSAAAASLCRRRSSQSSTSTTTTTTNTPLINYLTQKLSLPQSRALTILNRFQYLRTTENPESVVQPLYQFGFSDSQVRTIVRKHPQVLVSDADKVLKPKLQFLWDQLGLNATDLGELVSKNPYLLKFSLDNKLIPIVTTLKKILINDVKNQDLISIIGGFMFFRKDAHSRLLSNFALLGKCNIIGSQLSTLLKRNARILSLSESVLSERISRVLELGVPVNSRMFVYALSIVCSMSPEKFSNKLNVFRSFGFSEDECMESFRTSPLVFTCSEEKLKCGFDFFLNQMSDDDVKFEKSILVHHPYFLNYSLEKRVIPRLRVLKVIKRNKLTKKDPSLTSVLNVSEKVFLERYVLKYEDDVEKLLAAYKGEEDLLDSSSTSH